MNVNRVGSIRSTGGSSPPARAASRVSTSDRRRLSTPAAQSWNRFAEPTSPYREIPSAVKEPSRSHANPRYAEKVGEAG